jgi:hypothetical protein
VWWMRLGIRPERIEPGHPEQNGRHERMHRTLKAETASPPAESRRAQQRRFDEFRRVFNEERPTKLWSLPRPDRSTRSPPRSCQRSFRRSPMISTSSSIAFRRRESCPGEAKASTSAPASPTRTSPSSA